MVIFQLLRRKFWIQTWLSNCQHYLCLCHIVFEVHPDIHDQGKMLVLPNRLLYSVLSTSDQCFVSFQPILCHPRTQIRITLFDGVRISILNWKPSHNRTSKGCSQIAFPNNSPNQRMTVQISLKKNDWVFHTGPFGLLCFSRSIQISGHSDLGFFQ